MRPRIPLALTLGVLAFALAQSSARAAGDVPFHRCFRDTPSLQCGIVNVPLDRSGRVGGGVPLYVARSVARTRPGQPRTAVVSLAGGPGQSALPLFQDFADTLGPALRRDDLVVFDQRGTGLSGLLRCPTLERAPTGDPHKAVQACAAKLGAARAFYTSRDSADDIEAIRRAEGVEKLTLFGTSYGTKVALAYAQRYPDHVDRLVLDSVVPLDGPDPLDRDTFQAIPRVLLELCDAKACAGITPNPVGDLAELVRRLGTSPLSGYVVGGDGRRRARKIGRSSILDILFEGDFDPALRADFPAAVRSALAGDGAPLMRLARLAQVHDYFPPDPPSVFSAALFAATTCQEGPLPWTPTSSFNERWPAATRAAAEAPDGSFSPFDRATARANDLLRLCAPWPAGPAEVPDSRPLPDVPTLIVSGEFDLRTPVEDGAAVAAKLPHATRVVLPGVGHAVFGSDLSGCALHALDLFMAGKPVPAQCPPRSRAILNLLSHGIFPPSPVPPRSLADLATPRRLPGRAGRSVRGAELTFRDAVIQILNNSLSEEPARVARIGGLRDGRLVARYRPKIELRLDRYSYVPGLSVSGRLGDLSRNRLRLRVGGRAAARGEITLDFRKDRITGRLGGKRIRLGLMHEIEQAVTGLYVLRAKSTAERRNAARALARCCTPKQILPSG